MLLTLFALPLLGATRGLLGRSVGSFGVVILSTVAKFSAVVLALLGYWEVVASGSPVSLRLFEWFATGHLVFDASLQLDGVAVAMLLAVLVVSLSVDLYSAWYLVGDPHLPRFFRLISLFSWFMALLVMRTSLPLTFVGWEGIGVVSYLLISYWYTRLFAVQSAVQAFLFNRVGDMFLMLAMAAFASLIGGLSFTALGLSSGLSHSGVAVAVIFILLAAAGKRAQLGLHAWLPNAMEAPTPVSALIHAATLVTAGVYLLLRCAPALEVAPEAMACVAVLGALTSVFAGVTGLRQTDMKRVIAFSTCSQVAYMVLACGVGEYHSALFLLLTHAFYKALLFLGAGAVIHALAGLQDIRLMGGVGKMMPFVRAAMLIAAASLGAIPYTSGDFSKDVLIELVRSTHLLLHNVIWVLAVIRASLTLYYSGRLHRLAFDSEPRGSYISVAGLHDPDVFHVRAVLIILTVLALTLGFMGQDYFNASGGALGLSEWAATVSPVDSELHSRAILVLMPLIGALVGLVFGVHGISVGRAHRKAGLMHAFDTVSQTK